MGIPIPPPATAARVHRVNRHSNAASVFLFAGGMRHAERA